MESDLKTFMSSHKQYDKSTPHEFLNNYNMISYHRKDINTLVRILGESAFKQDNLIYIEEWRIEELKAQVEKKQPVKDREELIWSINKLKYRPFKELWNQYPNYVDDLAFRLNKAIEPLVIEDMGHTVVGYANCGEEAIGAFMNLKPDIITMDITLPGMDGVTCLKEIMERDPKAVVIMVTSHGQEQSYIRYGEDTF